MTEKQNPKQQFFYDDSAADEVHNMITDAYTSGYVNQQYGQNAAQQQGQQHQQLQEERYE